MVERYAREEMKSLWDMQAKYDAWLKVEIAAVKAWCELGLIPKEDAEKIEKNANYYKITCIFVIFFISNSH